MACSKDRDPAAKTDQFNWVACGRVRVCSLWGHGHPAKVSRASCHGKVEHKWLGAESPLRSEVTTLRLHIAHLPGVSSGQLREAGNDFGPAALVQWFSRWGDVPARQEEIWMKSELKCK